MPTYRGFLAASLAKLALVAPFFAKQAMAGHVEARTVEVIATTYLDLGHCYNACTTKAWHGWQTPGHKAPAYATHTLPAEEGCATTSVYTKHPECQVCKGSVFVYVPKTEYLARTTTVIKSIPTHASKEQSAEHTTTRTWPHWSRPTTTRTSAHWTKPTTTRTWPHWSRPSSTSKPSTTRKEPTYTRTWSRSIPLSSSKPSTTRREPTHTWSTSIPLSSSKPSTTRREPTHTWPTSRPWSSSTPSTTEAEHNTTTTTWTWSTSKRSTSSRLSSTTKYTSWTRPSTSKRGPTSTKRNPHPPTTKPEPTVGDAAAQCGNHQELSCCNTGNVVGGVLGNLLGGNCKPINIGILGVTVPLSNACNNQVACCTGDSNGLINLACTNINL